MLVLVGDTITHIRPNQVIESETRLSYPYLKDVTPKPKTQKKKRSYGTSSNS
jgi:hypothetical protein